MLRGLGWTVTVVLGMCVVVPIVLSLIWPMLFRPWDQEPSSVPVVELPSPTPTHIPTPFPSVDVARGWEDGYNDGYGDGFERGYELGQDKCPTPKVVERVIEYNDDWP